MNPIDFEKIIIAWKEAALDLQLKIQLPFILKTADNKYIQLPLLVEHFGSKQGTLIFSSSREFKDFNKMGYYCSALYPSYSIYNRILFIDTLNDWGYFGAPHQQPDWYNGQSW